MFTGTLSYKNRNELVTNVRLHTDLTVLIRPQTHNCPSGVSLAVTSLRQAIEKNIPRGRQLMLSQLSLKRALRGSCRAGPPNAGDMSQMKVSQGWVLAHAVMAGKWEASLHDIKISE